MHHSDLVFLYISNHIQLHAKITAKYVQKNAKGYSEICKYLFNIIIFDYMPKMQKEYLKICKSSVFLCNIFAKKYAARMLKIFLFYAESWQ